MGESKQWWVPLTGVLFVALLIVSFALQGDAPMAADESASTVAAYFADNDDKLFLAAFVQAAGLVALVAFFAHVRGLMREAVGDESMLPILVVAGATIFAAGAAFDAALLFATAETAGDIDSSGTETLVALFNNDFIPFQVGFVLWNLGAGIVALRTGMLPKWMGGLSIAIVAVSFTPIGFVGFFASGLWIVVASILLAVRARRPAVTA